MFEDKLKNDFNKELYSIENNLNEELSSYEKLIKDNHKEERIKFTWDNVGEELVE